MSAGAGASQTYASVTKIGKVLQVSTGRYAFSSRFADIINEDGDDTDNSSFFNDQDPSLAWSKRYFEALDMPERNNSERRAKYLILHCIHNDFVAAASTYAKTIISEHYLSDWRTLRPVSSIGGRGGEKYLVHGILFKFATGEGAKNEMFEGSDEFAAKAMGHEIKGVNSYIRTRTRLCYALQCLVDYKGFRMHCQAKLDIDSSTLKVGTADAGITPVKSEDPNLLNLMKYAANELNIREHMVGGQKLYSAGDCEGHRGKDGRYYVVDLARVFPPEFPGCLQRLGIRSAPIGLRQSVFVQRGGLKDKLARIINVYPADYRPNSLAPQVQYFDVLLLPEREVMHNVSINDIKRADQCIFWKFLRPEFVKSRGRSLIGKFEYDSEEFSELEKAVRRFADTYEEKIEELQGSPPRTGRKDTLDTAFTLSLTPEVTVPRSELAVETHPQPFTCGNNGAPAPKGEEFNSQVSVAGKASAYSVPSVPPLSDPKVSDAVCHDDLYSLGRPITDDDLYTPARPATDHVVSSVPQIIGGSGWTPLTINTADLSASSTSYVPPPPPPSSLTASPKSPRSLGSKQGANTSVNGNNISVFNSWVSNVRRLLQQPPQPLSSDAFSGFENGDADMEIRDYEVRCATKELLFVLIPTMAKDLLQNGHPHKRALITIADYLHYYGVNFRHGGYLRFVMLELFEREKGSFCPSAGYQPLDTTSSRSAASEMSTDEYEATPTFAMRSGAGATVDDLAGFTLARQSSHDNVAFKENGSSKAKKRAAVYELFIIQCDLLRECLTRTLKCMLREIQRDWMRSQKTASEQGIKRVIVQFLNLVCGSHPNSKHFWEEVVPKEVVDRFSELTLLAIPKSMGEMLFQDHENFEVEDARIYAWMGLPLSNNSGRLFEEVNPDDKRILRISDVVKYDSLFLFSVVDELCGMTGVKLSADCEAQRGNYKTMLESQLHGVEGEAILPNGSFYGASPRHFVQSPYPQPESTPHSGSAHRRDGSSMWDEHGSASKMSTLRSQRNYRVGSPSMGTPRFEDLRTPRSASWSGKSFGSRQGLKADAGLLIFKKAPPFIFVVADIQDIVPVVKHLHQLDLVTGAMLTLQAEKYLKSEQYVVAVRMLKTAIDTLFRARRAVPDDITTRHELADAFQMLVTSLQKQRLADEHLKQELELKIKRWMDEGQMGMDPFVTKLKSQLKDLLDSMKRNEPTEAQAKATYQHLHDMDKHTCCQYSKGSRISFRDDIIGIMIEVTYAYGNDTKDHQPFPSRKINEVIIEPGCISLSYFRQQYYSQLVSAREPSDDASSAASKREINASVRTWANRRFIPMIIDAEHASRALPLLKEELVRIDRLPMGKYESPISEDQGYVRSPADLKIRAFSKPGLPEFTPEIGFRVIAAIMNANVVKICKEASNGTFTADMIVEYLRLYHMLLYLADNDEKNDWRKRANEVVKGFINNKVIRERKHTPNLGWFLIYLLLSGYSWNKVSEAFFRESLRRQVFHYLVLKEKKAERPSHFNDDNSHYSIDDHDDLLSVGSTPRPTDFARAAYYSPSGPGSFFPREEEIQNENMDDSARYSPELAYLGDPTDEVSLHYRLFRTFEVTKMSGRICLFQIYFLQMVSGSGNEDRKDEEDQEYVKAALQKEELQIYNASLGFPTSMVRSELVDEFKKILAVNDYEGLLFRMQLFYTPKQMNIFLRNAVREAIKKDIVKGFDFDLLEGSRKPEDDTEFDILKDAVTDEELYREWSKLWEEARTTHAGLRDRYPEAVQRWKDIAAASKAKKAESSSPSKRRSTDMKQFNRPGKPIQPTSPRLSHKQRRNKQNEVLEKMIGIADRGSGARTYSAVVTSNTSTASNTFLSRFTLQSAPSQSMSGRSVTQPAQGAMTDSNDNALQSVRTEKPALSRTSSSSSIKAKSSTPQYGSGMAGFSPNSSNSRKQIANNRQTTSAAGGASYHPQSNSSNLVSKQSTAPSKQEHTRQNTSSKPAYRQSSFSLGSMKSELKSNSKDASDSVSTQSSHPSRRAHTQTTGPHSGGRPRSGSTESFLSLDDEKDKEKEIRANGGFVRMNSLPTKFEFANVPARGRSSSLGDMVTTPRDAHPPPSAASPAATTKLGANPALVVETKDNNASNAGKKSFLRAEAASFTPMSVFSAVSATTASIAPDHISLADSNANSRKNSITDGDNRSLCSYSSMSTIATVLDNGTIVPVEEVPVKYTRTWSKVAAGVDSKASSVEAAVSLLNANDDMSIGVGSGSNSVSNSERADFLDPVADPDLELEGTTIFNGANLETSSPSRQSTDNSRARGGSNGPNARGTWRRSKSLHSRVYEEPGQRDNQGGRLGYPARRWQSERIRSNSSVTSASEASYVHDATSSRPSYQAASPHGHRESARQQPGGRGQHNYKPSK